MDGSSEAAPVVDIQDDGTDVAQADTTTVTPTDPNVYTPPVFGAPEPAPSAPSSNATPTTEKNSQKKVPESVAKTPEQELEAIEEEAYEDKHRTLGDVLLMSQYDLLASGRAIVLLRMPHAELEQQPEYAGLKKLLQDKEKNRAPEDQNSNYLERMAPTVAELKEKYKGKTTEKAFEEFEEEDAAKQSTEILTEKIKEETAGGIELSEARLAELKVQSDKEGKRKAKYSIKIFLAKTILQLGDFIIDGLADSDFSAFLDNFFSAAVSRGRGYSRYQNSGAEKNGGTMIFEREAMDHLKSRENLVEILNDFWENLHATPEYSHISKPEKLKSGIDQKDISKADLREILVSLSSLLLKEITNPNSAVLKAFESAVVKSMGRPENSMINDQLFLTMIKIGDSGSSRLHDEFAAKFTDAPEEAAPNITEFSSDEAQDEQVTLKAAA